MQQHCMYRSLSGFKDVPQALFATSFGSGTVRLLQRTVKRARENKWLRWITAQSNSDCQTGLDIHCFHCFNPSFGLF